jgi:UDP-glucose-4-epimerase GalE
MRVLVTGGSGYIGSHAVRALVRHGHQVVIYDNLSTGHAGLSEDFPLVCGDIADQSKLERCLENVDLVMHFAGSAYVGESVQNPHKYFENNVQSGLRLVDSLLKCEVKKIVFSSSCAVYGTPQLLPIVESSPKEPINPYGDTKLFFERVLAAYAHSHGLRYAALRYFNAAGASEDGTIGECHDPETHIIPLALRAALGSGSSLKVFGNSLPTPDGTCVRDFIHVEDLAQAHVRAAEYLESGGTVTALNLGTGRGTSLRELLREIERVTGCPVPHRLADARFGDPPALYADPARAQEVLGWRAEHDLADMIRTAFTWERSGFAKLQARQEPGICRLSRV